MKTNYSHAKIKKFSQYSQKLHRRNAFRNANQSSHFYHLGRDIQSPQTSLTPVNREIWSLQKKLVHEKYSLHILHHSKVSDSQSKLLCFPCRYIISMNSTAMNNMSTTNNENNAVNYPSMLWIAPTSLALLIITGNSMVIGACFHFAKSQISRSNYSKCYENIPVLKGNHMFAHILT